MCDRHTALTMLICVIGQRVLQKILALIHMYKDIPELSIRGLPGLSDNHISLQAALVHSCSPQPLELNPTQYHILSINYMHDLLNLLWRVEFVPEIKLINYASYSNQMDQILGGEKNQENRSQKKKKKKLKERKIVSVKRYKGIDLLLANHPPKKDFSAFFFKNRITLFFSSFQKLP